MSRVAGAHWCLHSCRRTMPRWCCASRAARAILRGKGPEVLSCQTTTRPSSSGCGSCGHHRSGWCRRSDRNETTVRFCQSSCRQTASPLHNRQSVGSSRGVTPSWSPSRSQQWPAANTPTERQGECVEECAENTATAIVAPSVTRQHTPSNTNTQNSRRDAREHDSPFQSPRAAAIVLLFSLPARPPTPIAPHSRRIPICRWTAKETHRHVQPLGGDQSVVIPVTVNDKSNQSTAARRQHPTPSMSME
ncbi:hypothetical protein TcCL_ESM10234 [Trypanosoma cruzi]|nr:hypothetical protein TcCL_ESM10234 [Trypanosoma cruzi]